MWDQDELHPWIWHMMSILVEEIHSNLGHLNMFQTQSSKGHLEGSCAKNSRHGSWQYVCSFWIWRNVCIHQEIKKKQHLLLWVAWCQSSDSRTSQCQINDPKISTFFGIVQATASNMGGQRLLGLMWKPLKLKLREAEYGIKDRDLDDLRHQSTCSWDCSDPLSLMDSLKFLCTLGVSIWPFHLEVIPCCRPTSLLLSPSFKLWGAFLRSP